MMPAGPPGWLLTSAPQEYAQRYTSDRADVLRLRSFLPLGRVELDLLVLIQRPVAGTRDRGKVDEHVRRPVIGGDETKALIGVEPLHGACCHQSKSLIHVTGAASPRRPQAYRPRPRPRNRTLNPGHRLPQLDHAEPPGRAGR